MRALPKVAAVVVLALAQAVAVPADAEITKWDHEANIKDAATRLAILHKQRGSPGVLKFLDACYRTHTIATDYTSGLEACMAQDYMHSKLLALIYSKVEDQRLKTLGAPLPAEIERGMARRFIAINSQYKLTPKAAEEFKSLVDTYGFPLFVKSVFPNSSNGTPPAPGSPPGKAPE